MNCPLCGKQYRKALYMGMPLRICEDESCSCAQGIGLWFMTHVPLISPEENERREWALFFYEGSYVKALWSYLTQ